MIIFFPDRGQPHWYNWTKNSTHSTNCATVFQISDIIYFITTNCTEKHSYECEQGYCIPSNYIVVLLVKEITCNNDTEKKIDSNK